MFEIVTNLSVIIALLSFFIIVYHFFRSILWGAPYAPSDKGKIERMLTFVQIEEGEQAVDIGSGDGRIVIELARKGAIATGFERNPILVAISNWKIRRVGLKDRAHVYRRNFWKEDFSSFDVVTIFGINYIMPGLEKKLTKELRSGTRLAVNYFPFPHWKPKRTEKAVYYYEK